ncbi:MAG: sigma factor [Syntrophus sp. (in: bacteria)]
MKRTDQSPISNTKNIMEAIDRDYDSLSPHSQSSRSSLTEKMYYRSLPLIKSVVKRYQKLDTVNDRDDLINQAYLGVHDAVTTFRPNSGAKFSSVLTWCIQKQFEKICPSSNKQVDVTYPDGRKVVMAYKKFQKIKKQLLAESAEWTVSSRYTHLDDTNGGREPGDQD